MHIYLQAKPSSHKIKISLLTNNRGRGGQESKACTERTERETGQIYRLIRDPVPDGRESRKDADQEAEPLDCSSSRMTSCMGDSAHPEGDVQTHASVCYRTV